MQPLLYHLRTKSIFLVFLIALLYICTLPLIAQPCNTSFKVQKKGSGRPMILIPGLYCSGSVWDEAVTYFSTRFECHTITLPGFAGQPPLRSDSLLPAVAKQIACYIRENKLEKPVIVGHSLGGWLALELGVRYPDVAGDIVCVSSAPFLPALTMGTGINADSARKIGLQIKRGMEAQQVADVKAAQHYMLRSMIRDTNRIPQVTNMAVQSDPATQAQAMYELFSCDLRPLLKNIRSRILVLGDWIAYRQYGATHENVYDNLKAQFEQAGNVTIAISDTSRHFIMFDEPQWFYEQTDRFLAHH
ncbi:MAG TPA: alpha/beta hydrolase [Chitinophaga sp.]